MQTGWVNGINGFDQGRPYGLNLLFSVGTPRTMEFATRGFESGARETGW
jgi:hypothetical protein